MFSIDWKIISPSENNRQIKPESRPDMTNAMAAALKFIVP
ncbi:hypothetical protein LHK_01050 [Laribacter hongkongensis HLHK9]|uniref:Uncharacterized protein n=2 Tax=Laribacter hongkongensis TaxID=168471 RepID=C1D611_LARHH|nr:hypothetical protein LHK_01050 [Laribacter hongkongensis HLHK9]ASJ23993.1 hypothetical protein LHGZ1_1162 [Laribacter hongkongensis]